MSVAFSLTAQATPPTGLFTCTSGAFQVLNKQLVEIDPATGATTNVGPPSSITYNAMGFNPADGYLYGITVKSGSPHVVRIGANGAPVDLGVPTGASWGAKPLFLTADVDDSNQLVVTTTPNQLWKINLTTLVAHSTILAAQVAGSDSVFVAGSLYSLQGNRLYVTNETTGAASSFKVSGLQQLGVGGLFGAGFVDGDGNLKFASYATGGFVKITGFQTSSPSATTTFSGTVVANTDGATCRPVASSATDTVSYNAEGGSAVSSQTGLDGTTITLASAPTRAGYTFNGWFAASSGGSPLTSPYTLNGDVTLFAQWTFVPVVDYTVTFVTNGGLAVSPITVPAGTSVTIPSDVHATDPPDHPFRHWSTNSDGTGTIVNGGSSLTVNSDVTLYAQFETV